MTNRAPLIPPFSWHQAIVEPWTDHQPGTLWMVLTAILLAVPCALLGNYLILRRMALVGDAISHSVLPGLVLAYLLFRDLGTGYMLGGAIAAGLLTTLLIDFLTAKTKLKSDAATGIAYTTLFALGMYLVNRYTSRVHLDAECVLFGELEYIPLSEPSALRVGEWGFIPMAVLISLGAALAVGVLLKVFAKELKVTSFDPGFARSAGVRVGFIHYGLMALLSLIVVTSLERVGILVVALLVLPGSTAQFFTRRLARLHLLSVIFAVTGVLGGFHLGSWLLVPTAASIALWGGLQFGAAWMGTLALQSWRRAQMRPAR